MNQRYKLQLRNNGYLQIDFAFALFVFMILFIIVYGIFSEYKENTRNDLIIQELTDDAKDICFMLTQSSGSPVNWENDINQSIYLGLKDSNLYSLKTDKLNRFVSSNYYIILDKFAIEENMGIKIIGMNSDTVYLNFGVFTTNLGTNSANYVCYSNYNSEIVKVLVEVWK